MKIFKITTNKSMYPRSLFKKLIEVLEMFSDAMSKFLINIPDAFPISSIKKFRIATKLKFSANKAPMIEPKPRA